MNKMNQQWLSESMGQWTDESMKRWLSESMTRWIGDSVNQWTNAQVELVSQWISESTTQWINGSMIQSVNESWLNRWINEPRNQWVNEWRNWAILIRNCAHDDVVDMWHEHDDKNDKTAPGHSSVTRKCLNMFELNFLWTDIGWQWFLIKFSSNTSELRTDVQGLSCHHVHVSSCQPHHHVKHSSGRNWEEWQFGNARVHGWKHSPARNLVFFRVKWLPWSPVAVSGVAGVDLKSAQDCRVWFSLQSLQSVKKTDGPGALLGRWGRQNGRETVARAWLPLQHVQKTHRRGTLLEDEVGKLCTGLWQELDLHKKSLKIKALAALLEDEVGKMSTILYQELIFTQKSQNKLRGSEHSWKMRSVRIAQNNCLALKNRPKMMGSEHCWLMKLAKSARDCSESSISQKNRERNWGDRMMGALLEDEVR